MEALKMTQNAEVKPKTPIIHIARIQPDGNVHYLLLRKLDAHTFTWFKLEGERKEEKEEKEKETNTSVSGSTVPEAIQLAYKHWKGDSFRPVNCGFRYTLPERDEHGCDALFHQMVASYSSMNGVYFDDDLGHNCIVNFASSEGRDLWKKLKEEGRL
jgi:hypothetical protein